MKVLFVLLAMIVFTGCSCLAARNPAAYDRFIADLTRQAEQEGISGKTLALTMPSLYFDPSVIALDRKQPESRMSFGTYLKSVVSPLRVSKGQALRLKYARTLAKIYKRYGVPPGVVIALWGVESSYGVNPGNYSVLNSVATMAYEGRRAAFFRKEFIESLRVIDKENISSDLMRGSWAGAMGQCQFMPSTYRAYAVDFNRDGKRDIWRDPEDVMASIANYIKAEGWKPNWRWGREVQLTKKIEPNLIGLDVRHNLATWSKKGVRTKSGKLLPSVNVSASLIQPDGDGSRAFLIYDNFRAVMRWNRSTYFATSVGLLSDQIDGIK